MKRNITLLSAVVLAGVTAGAGVLDLGSQARLRAGKTPIEISQATGSRSEISIKKRVAVENQLHGFILLAPGTETAVVEGIDGLEVTHRRGNILLARFNEDALADLNALEGVRQVSLAREVTGKLDIARRVSGIDKIHSGEGLPQAYTGRGVVAGICDGGFDPNHINFKNEDGSSRIKQFTYYALNSTGTGFSEYRYGEKQIPNIDTDDSSTFHGTHTLGIMAGGYRGKVKAGVLTEAKAGIYTVDNPYYGVAYDADIVTASGTLTDENIAYGVESMLDYAYATKQPLVVNLSLGSNVGPHDGTSMICQYIDAVTNDDQVNTIFCISAGNEGDIPIALKHTFEEDGEKVGSFIGADYSQGDYRHIRYGQSYLYSNDETGFDIQAVVFNTKRNVVAMRMPLEASSTGAIKYWVSSSAYVGEEGDIVSAQLARYFEGYVGVGSTFDPTSGRYYAVLDLYLFDNVTGSNSNGDYILGFEITGKKGQQIAGYTDGNFNYFTGRGVDGYIDGTFDGTINDIATGHTPIVVGSYDTRDSWLSLDNYIYGYQNTFVPGHMSPFTSYGTLLDGRQLPTVCAPGATIISSANEYYMDEYKLGNSERQASVSDSNRTYTWFQCVGTSMSSPLVAGTIATWLEADPTLTAAEARNIILSTAVHDNDVDESGTAVQWGAGKFDAYAGLKQVLANASVISIGADNNTPLIEALAGNCYRVIVPGIDGMNVTVYDLTGREVARHNAAGDEIIIDLSGLAGGIYILKAAEGHSVKISVK